MSKMSLHVRFLICSSIWTIAALATSKSVSAQEVNVSSVVAYPHNSGSWEDSPVPMSSPPPISAEQAPRDTAITIADDIGSSIDSLVNLDAELVNVVVPSVIPIAYLGCDMMCSPREHAKRLAVDTCTLYCKQAYPNKAFKQRICKSVCSAKAKRKIDEVCDACESAFIAISQVPMPESSTTADVGFSR